MKPTWAATLTVAMGVVGTPGCASLSAGAELPSLSGTAWVLSALPDRLLLARPLPTARFEAGTVQGSDGCNRYSAPYSTKGSTLTIGPAGASTQMACPPEVMAQAGAFLAALFSARSYRVSGEQLQLLGGDGAVLSAFARQATGLANTAWQVTAINNGKGGVASLVPDTAVTMDFAADGTVAGSAGCNAYTSSYKTDGDKLRFTPASATRRMCATAGVMEQEQAFFQALEVVATMRLEGERLEMRGADGALAVSLLRATLP